MRSTYDDGDQADAVAVQDLSVSFGAVHALRGLNLSISAGSACGLIGPNGAGKSTLVKALAGLVRANGGNIQIGGRPLAAGNQADAARLGVRLVPQEALIVSSATVAENISLGSEPRRLGLFVDERAMRATSVAALARVGLAIPPDTLAGTLSLPEQRLVMVAAALKHDLRLLILDEPTAALSPAEAQGVLAAIRGVRKLGVATIFVSHRFDEIIASCSRVVGVRDGRVVADWADHSATVDGMAAVVGGTPPSPAGPTMSPRVSSKVLLDCQEIHGRELRGVSLATKRGEIVGIVGRPGSGAQELLDVLGGASRPTRGVVRLEDRPLTLRTPADAFAAGIGYLSPDRVRTGIATLSIRENIVLSALPSLRRWGIVVDKRREGDLARAHVPPNLASRLDADFWTLSGGNRQRVLVSRLVASGTCIFVLSDPTVGVDVKSRGEFRQTLRELVTDDRCAIVYSSQPEELAGLADVVYVFEDGQMSQRLIGAGVTEENLLKAASFKGEIIPA